MMLKTYLLVEASVKFNSTVVVNVLVFPTLLLTAQTYQITQDTKLKFGNKCHFRVSPMVFLSGSKIQIDGTLEGASPLEDWRRDAVH
jgi:hypothetical protein